MSSAGGWLAWLFWCRSERRLRAAWRLLATLALLGVTMLAAGAVARLLARWGVADAAVLVLHAAAVLAALWLAARGIDRRPLHALGLRLGRTWWLDAAFGLALGTAMIGSIFLVQLAAGWTVITGAGAVGSADAGVALAAAVLLPAVTALVEELVLRAYPLRTLAEGVRGLLGGRARAVGLAWLVTSGVFGLLHGMNPNATPAAVVNVVGAGLLLGLGYVLTGQLGLPLGLHFGWNFFEGGVFGLPVSGQAPPVSLLVVHTDGPELWTGGAFGPEAGLPCTIAMCLGAVAVVAWVRWRCGAVRFCGDLAFYEPIPDRHP